VTQEYNLLGERTTIGLRAVNDAVRFHDPDLQPGNKAIRKYTKVALRSAHAVYLKHIEGEKAEASKKQEKEGKQEQETEDTGREKDNIEEKGKSLNEVEF